MLPSISKLVFLVGLQFKRSYRLCVWYFQIPFKRFVNTEICENWLNHTKTHTIYSNALYIIANYIDIVKLNTNKYLFSFFSRKTLFHWALLNANRIIGIQQHLIYQPMFANDTIFDGRGLKNCIKSKTISPNRQKPPHIIVIPKCMA